MIRINLLPKRRRRLRLLPGSGVVAVVLLVIASLAGSYLYGTWRNDRLRTEINALNRKLVDVRPKVAAVRSLQESLDQLRLKEGLLRSLEAREIPWANILVDLADRTPSDAWLSSAAVNPGTGTHLTLQGAALSYNAVARFMVGLGTSRFYSDVDLQTAQSTTISTTPVVQFGLVATMRPSGETSGGTAQGGPTR